MEANSSTPDASRLSTVLRHFVKAMRPVQWVKNVFVLAPLVFGLRLFDGLSLALAGLTFVLFSLISSAVYLLNDLSDREADARHPTKRFRPIASGALPADIARFGMVALLVGGLCGAMLFDWRVALVLTGYFAMNVAYTSQLKHYAFVDIGCIALGFLLRVLAGGLAIEVPVSGWLLACTFLLASLLALGKRHHELRAVVETGKTAGTRKVLERYRVSHIEGVMRVLAVVTVCSYAAYTLSASTIANFGTSSLIWSVPFVAVGLLRYSQLVGRHTEAQSPTDTMVRDLPFLLNIGLYSVFITAVIYFQW